MTFTGSSCENFLLGLGDPNKKLGKEARMRPGKPNKPVQWPGVAMERDLGGIQKFLSNVCSYLAVWS